MCAWKRYSKQLKDISKAESRIALVQFSSVVQLTPTLCNPMDCSMPDFPIHNNSKRFLKLMSIESVMPSNHLILCHPLLFYLQFFQVSGSFLMSQYFASGGQIIGVSASASVPPMIIQNWFPLDWLVWSCWSPRDSQESFPTLQFKSIDSSAFSFLYSSTLISIHDYWRNHSFD